MIADGLRIGRTNADIDQRDPAAIGRDQVIGGHLMLAPCTVGDHARWIGRLPRHIDAACAGQGGVG